MVCNQLPKEASPNLEISYLLFKFFNPTPVGLLSYQLLSTTVGGGGVFHPPIKTHLEAILTRFFYIGRKGPKYQRKNLKSRV